MPSLAIRKTNRLEIKSMMFPGPVWSWMGFTVYLKFLCSQRARSYSCILKNWNCNLILSTHFESPTAKSHSCQSACKKVSKNWGGNFNLACAVIIIAIPKQLLYPTMASRVRNSFDWHRKRFLEESIFQNVDMSSWANFNGQLSLAYPVILSHRFWNLHLDN